ncbi:MAG: extracellular matrix regulator RemB [Eubacterium sp.]
MYLYLGGDTVIKTENILGIFDMDTSTVNKATRDYLSKAEKEKRVIYVNYELPKSFIVCEDKIYICPLNTATLLKRVSI